MHTCTCIDPTQAQAPPPLLLTCAHLANPHPSHPPAGSQADLAELAQHKYGYRVVVQLLHPNSGRYLPPQLLAIAQPPPKEYSAEAMQRGGGGAAAATDAAVDETKPQKKKKKQEQKEAAAEGNDSDEEGEVRGALAGSVLVRLAL